MSRHRQPFPWEDQPDPLEGVPAFDVARVVVMPPESASTGAALVSGEFPGVRESRDEQVNRMMQHTDGSDAAREWVVSKAGGAVQTWDRGVRDGSITRQR